MTNAEQLKPCPFCDNRQPFLHEGSSGDWRIVCGRCLDESGTDWCPTKAQAIAAWNTRPGEERAAREAVAAFAARLMAKVEERRKAAIFASEDALRCARTGKIAWERRAWEKAEMFMACAVQWDEISDLLKEEAQHDS